MSKKRFHNRNYEQGPCPKCTSSDAFTEYENGTKHCFACGHHEGSSGSIPEKVDLTFKAMRGLSEATMRHYYAITELVDGVPSRIVFPYKTFKKIRGLQEKTFKCSGDVSPQLFGMDKFDAGSRDSITITEGEFDAMSIYQTTKGDTAGISVRSASSAKKDISENYDYVNSFNKIILAFDMDGPGQDAKEQVKSLFDPRKVYVLS